MSNPMQSLMQLTHKKHPVLFVISVAAVLIFLAVYLFSGGDWENLKEFYSTVLLIIKNVQILEFIISMLVVFGSLCLLVLVCYGLLCAVAEGIREVKIEQTSNIFGEKISRIIKSLTILTIGSLDTALRCVAFIPSFFDALISLLDDDETDDHSKQDTSKPGTEQKESAGM